MAAPGDLNWIYIVDTSSWLSIEGHPAQNRILSALVPLIEKGRIKFPPQVWDEFKETSNLVSWLEPYRDICIERRNTDPTYFAAVGQVAHEFSGMSGSRGTKERADPWIVAMAIHSQGMQRRWLVVCDESKVKRPNRRITGACVRYKVMCMSLMEMLDQEYPDDGWLDDDVNEDGS